MIVKDPQKAANMGQWIQAYGGNNSNPLLENSTLGSLSTDNVYVYAVEDLAVPPHPNFAMQMQMNGMRSSFGHLDKEVSHSRLQAFELETSGKIKWELGGPSSESQ